MQSPQVETLGPLERRISLSVQLPAIEAEVAGRLREIARTARMDGFRKGKVPMSVIGKQYGGEVRQEVLGRSLEQAFATSVSQLGLRVAGFPRIEAAGGEPVNGALEFYAVFDVYPEVSLGDLSTVEVVRPVVPVTDAEVDRTLDILARQRTVWAVVARPAALGDRVRADFAGTIDGQPFAGGEGKDIQVELGAGRTLKEFETGFIGLSAGETTTVEVSFPADYHGRDVAGKTARFALTVHEVSEPVVPAIDQVFASSLGIEGGDVASLRAEIRGNLEREVKQRIRARVKEQVMDGLLACTSIELPKSMVQAEVEGLMAQMRRDLQERGMKSDDASLPVQMLEKQAERRVALGLILSDVVQKQKLSARPEQVRAMIDEMAQNYEDPQELVNWYRSSPERMQEIQSLAVEDNAVEWILSQVKVTDRDTTFEELMGRSK